jgi:hypothetical protein
MWQLAPLQDTYDYSNIQEFVDYTVSLTNKTLSSKGITFKVRWQS